MQSLQQIQGKYQLKADNFLKIVITIQITDLQSDLLLTSSTQTTVFMLTIIKWTYRKQNLSQKIASKTNQKRKNRTLKIIRIFSLQKVKKISIKSMKISIIDD